MDRLDSVFRALNKTPKGQTCEAMKGLLAEGEQMIDAKGDPTVKDAALIAAGQRVEHYEIAGYAGQVACFALGPYRSGSLVAGDARRKKNRRIKN